MSEVYDKEYFEGSRSNYGKSGGYSHYTIEAVLAFITKMMLRLFHPRSVLDVGCAYGYITNRIKQGHSYGIDISNYAIKEARMTNKLLLASGTHIPFKNNSFDLVICVEVLEHLTEEEIMLTLSEIGRVGKGTVYMSTPSAEKQNYLEDDDDTHITFWKRNKYIEICTELGWLYNEKSTDFIMGLPYVKAVRWNCYVFNLTKGKV
jgi:2-polyprenyl-3-methyl-5-hydroxy-6-metoxy-1,4-benzoquinol methylase